MVQNMKVVHNAYSPAETVELAGRAGCKKANMRFDKMFISSVVAGMLLSFACAVSLITQTAPWYQENAPGLIRMIGALVFPVGLVMVLLSGTDLCTGSFMVTTVAALQRRIPVWKMLMHWTVTFFGNLAGSLFMVAIIMGYGGLFDQDPYKSQVFAYNYKKVVSPEWHMILFRAVGANWLVCMACFFAFQAREFSSKIAAIWPPTFAFVALGLDHVVANMFFVPLSIWLEDSKITVVLYIWKSMIPALIGNIIGGALFVGVTYWYLHLSSEDEVAIDGGYYGETQPHPLLSARPSGVGIRRPASMRINSQSSRGHLSTTSLVSKSAESMV